MHHRKRSLCTFLAASITPAIRPASALIFNLPPSARLALGEDGLRRDCEVTTEGGGASIDECFVWERNANEGYQVASCIFGSVARASGDATDGACVKTLWFPSVDDSKMILALVDVVCSNSAQLGGVTAKAEFWPKVPATKISLCWPSSRSENTGRIRSNASLSSIEAATEATERWVDDTLGGLSLCPYTRSLRQGAVGLGSVGVEEGPVGVRHSCSPHDIGGAGLQSGVPTVDALLAAAFWSGVTELATTPEAELATLLIVAPPPYDRDFIRFAATCDELLEPAVQAVGADAVVGKAWFHPLYEASVIGHDTLLPGHALPSTMVKKFVDTYYGDDFAASSSSEDSGKVKKAGELSMNDISRANDEVRHTPHATVNLLRRSQLSAAKEAEAASAVKRPNAIYARNVFRIASEWNRESS